MNNNNIEIMEDPEKYINNIKNVSMDEIEKGYIDYINKKIKSRDITRKWQKDNIEKVSAKNKRHYNKIKLEQPEKYQEMLKIKSEKQKLRYQQKKILSMDK